MSDEWGPWIEHDGRGCPCVGEYGQFIYGNGTNDEGIAGENCIAAGYDPNGFGSSWVWGFKRPSARIIRYRIRKPRGLTILEQLLQDLPQETYTIGPLKITVD